MANKSGIVSLIPAIVFGVLAVVTLPGFFSYFYRAGAGHAMRDIIESENLQWDSMSNAERVPYLARGKSEGLKCAFLMILGEHIPLYLLAIITIGLIRRSKSRRFRNFLRLAFFGVWILGMLFLSLGIGKLIQKLDKKQVGRPTGVGDVQG